MLLMTASLLVSQAQEIQIIGPQSMQPAPTGLFGRLRTWRAPAYSGAPVERPFVSRMQERFGGIFSRSQSREVTSGQTIFPSVPVTPSGPHVTTNEPPILEQYATPRPTSTSGPPHP